MVRNLPLAHYFKFPLSKRLRKHPLVNEFECIPLMRPLRLEIPPNPAPSPLFKRRHLRLDISPRRVLVLLAPLVDIVLPRAIPHLVSTAKRSIVPCPRTEPIKVSRAVRHRACPLPDNAPLVAACICTARCADLLHVLRG